MRPGQSGGETAYEATREARPQSSRVYSNRMGSKREGLDYLTARRHAATCGKILQMLGNATARLKQPNDATTQHREAFYL